MSLSPESLLLLQPEASVFTRPTFCQMRTLVYGTLLASGRRTVAAARRSMGRGAPFYHISPRSQPGGMVSFPPEPYSSRTPGDGVLGS